MIVNLGPGQVDLKKIKSIIRIEQETYNATIELRYNCGANMRVEFDKDDYIDFMESVNLYNLTESKRIKIF